MEADLFQTAGDLLAATEFVEWLVAPAGLHRRKWLDWMEAQPHRGGLVEEATEMYQKMMLLREPAVDAGQVNAQLLKLLMMIQALSKDEAKA